MNLLSQPASGSAIFLPSIFLPCFSPHKLSAALSCICEICGSPLHHHRIFLSVHFSVHRILQSRPKQVLTRSNSPIDRLCKNPENLPKAFNNSRNRANLRAAFQHILFALICVHSRQRAPARRAAAGLRVCTSVRPLAGGMLRRRARSAIREFRSFGPLYFSSRRRQRDNRRPHPEPSFAREGRTRSMKARRCAVPLRQRWRRWPAR